MKKKTGVPCMFNKGKHFFLTLISFFLINSVCAASSEKLTVQEHNESHFVARSIEVLGLDGDAYNTFMHYFPLKPGDQVTPQRTNDALHRLMRLGLYHSVSFSRDGDTLRVLVSPRPLINKIVLRGNQSIHSQDLLKAFAVEGLSSGRLLDESLLKRLIEEVKVEYEQLNKDSVDIHYTVTPLSQHSVNIYIFVHEPPYSFIRRIRFFGNKRFAQSELIDQLNLREPNFWSWYTKSDRFSWNKFKKDGGSITDFYKENGYLDASLLHTNVTFSEGRGHVFLDFDVSEGAPYRVNRLICQGSELIDEKQCASLVQQKKGRVYNQKKIDEASARILSYLKQRGYAFATVDSRTDKDVGSAAQGGLVDVYFDISTGKKVYIRRINISGNTQTADYVLRREFRQYESSGFDATRIERSQERLQRLGFFSSVDIHPRPVPGVDDLVDLDVAVREQQTGSLQFGLGYSSAEKLSFSTVLSYKNLWGTGNAASLALSTSKIQRSLSLSYNNPYWTDTGISRGFEVYQVYNNPTSLQVGHYKTLSTGAGITFALPVNEYDTIAWGLNIDKTRVTVYEDSPDRFKDYVKLFGPNSVALTQNLTFTRDYRDSILYPTKGYVVQLYGTQTIPGSPIRFYKVGAQYQQYITLFKNFVLMFGLEADYGNGMGGKPLPFFRNYYAGGIGSVRGYQTNSLGPQDKDGQALGGNSMYTGTVSVLFPVPGIGLDRSLRMSVFLDAGQVFGAGDVLGRYSHVRLRDLRYSYGVSLFWLSPVGPLNFSYGIPIHKQPWEKEERFQFTVGTTF